MDVRPTLPLLHLDTLWLQVAGTVCNIACRHCFVSCGPKNERHRMMPLEDVRAALAEGEALGMREVWYTGGEPFLHPEILAVIDAALSRAPLGILTNGMLIDARLAAALGERFREAPHNLEIRVSLDGATPEANDRVRGVGVFEATCRGIRNLTAHGLEPVLAVTAIEDLGVEREALVRLLGELGVTRPRVKWIPPFRIGREAHRGRRYARWERLAAADVADPEAPWRLQCGRSRTVTSEGVFPCPILVDEPDRRLGGRLAEALGDHPVDHPACHTCWVEGFSCST